jgi:hypothetical protein
MMQKEISACFMAESARNSLNDFSCDDKISGMKRNKKEIVLLLMTA